MPTNILNATKTKCYILKKRRTTIKPKLLQTTVFHS